MRLTKRNCIDRMKQVLLQIVYSSILIGAKRQTKSPSLPQVTFFFLFKLSVKFISVFIKSSFIAV